MNGKRAKAHRKVADKIALAWLKTLVTEQEAEQYTSENFKNYMPKQTHIMTDRQMSLMPHSYRWFTRLVKKFGLEQAEQRILKAGKI